MAHTSLLYMALSSRSRIASSQLAEVRGSTYKCHHRKSKGSYTTDVRSADLKATSHCRREESVPKPVHTDG